MVVSEPMGAGVYENDQFVCQTPCTVQHPAHAPLPRTFVFKLPGYHDKTYEMTDASQPISVQLVHLHAAAMPPPAGPRPSIGRER